MGRQLERQQFGDRRFDAVELHHDSRTAALPSRFSTFLISPSRIRTRPSPITKTATPIHNIPNIPAALNLAHRPISSTPRTTPADINNALMTMFEQAVSTAHISN